MRLSRDATEALLLLGGFLFVVAVGALTMLVWPTHIHGNFRLFIAIGVATCIAIPLVLKLRSRVSSREPGANGKRIGDERD